MYSGIVEAITRELHELDDKYVTGARLGANELEQIDRMAHALKCVLTSEAMLNSTSERERYRPRYYDDRRY